jgi:hypothetical protein
MLDRGEREALLAAVVELYVKGGASERGWPEEIRSVPRTAFAGSLDAEQEALVAEVSDALWLIVSAVSASSKLEPPPRNAVIASLGGAEMVMRAEIVAGKTDWLPKLLSSFTYLATVAFLERDEALRLAERAAELCRAAEHSN